MYISIKCRDGWMRYWLIKYANKKKFHNMASFLHNCIVAMNIDIVPIDVVM